MASTVNQEGAVVNDLAANLYSFKVFTYCFGQMSVNTLYFIPTINAGFGASSGKVAKAMFDNMKAAWRDCIPVAAELLGAKVQEVLPAPLKLPGVVVEGSLTGTEAGDPMPTGLSITATLQTGFAGISRRGRIFFPFISNVRLDTDGHPEGNICNLIKNAIEVITNYTSATVDGTDYSFQWVVYSRTSNLKTPIVNIRVLPKWATQRRRGDFGNLEPKVVD